MKHRAAMGDDFGLRSAAEYISGDGSPCRSRKSDDNLALAGLILTRDDLSIRRFPVVHCRPHEAGQAGTIDAGIRLTSRADSALDREPLPVPDRRFWRFYNQPADLPNREKQHHAKAGCLAAH